MVERYAHGRAEVEFGRAVERIGCLGFMLPEPQLACGVADIGYGGPLRCYSDTGLFYTSTPGQECDFIISTGEQLPSVQRLKAVPNPFTNRVELRCGRGQQAPDAVQVFSLAGELVTSVPVSGCPVVVEPEVPAGCYMVQARWGDAVQTLRLVKME